MLRAEARGNKPTGAGTSAKAGYRVSPRRVATVNADFLASTRISSVAVSEPRPSVQLGFISPDTLPGRGLKQLFDGGHMAAQSRPYLGSDGAIARQWITRYFSVEIGVMSTTL